MVITKPLSTLSREVCFMQLFSISFIDFFHLFLWLLSSIGIYRIFKQFHVKGWWAFIH